MTAVLSVSFSAELGELWRVHVSDDLHTMSRAMTIAMHAVRDIGDPILRADVRGAGDFSKRWWGKAFKIQAFPDIKVGSLGASISVTHKIPYAGVFEDGEVIHGQPFLWLPLGPERIGRRGSHRLTPKSFRDETGQDLIMWPHGNELLLGARIRVGNKTGKAPSRVTFPLLKRGTGGEGGSIATVPIFVGVKLARIGKKFHVHEIVQGQMAPLVPEAYLKAMEALNG